MDIAFKPLTPYREEDFTPAKYKYFQSWVEFAAENYQQVMRRRSTAGTLYTVPEGHIFYLTNLSFNFFKSSSAAGIEIEIIPSVDTLNTFGARSPAGVLCVQDFNFSMPLKFSAGTQFALSVDALAADVHFFGFLVKFS